jgi:membrane associated rhomboid family serine protease
MTSMAEPRGFLLRFRGLLILMVLVWLVSIANLLSGGSFNQYGIYPGKVSGLRGIAFAPFLHGGLMHLLSNTLPMLFLGALVSLRGQTTFWTTTVFVAVVGGLGVWLLGRPAFHIGASGLVFGYFGYLVALGWFERKLGSIAVAVLTLVLYSGLVWGVLPLRAFVSWEGHLFGMLAGALVAYFGASKEPPH